MRIKILSPLRGLEVTGANRTWVSLAPLIEIEGQIKRLLGDGDGWPSTPTPSVDIITDKLLIPNVCSDAYMVLSDEPFESVCLIELVFQKRWVTADREDSIWDFQ